MHFLCVYREKIVLNKYCVLNLELYKDSLCYEAQYIEISGNGLKTKIALGNIYRPPRPGAQLKEFFKECLPTLKLLSEKYKNLIIVGDVNIDFLKLNNNADFAEYFDNINTLGLLTK